MKHLSFNCFRREVSAVPCLWFQSAVFLFLRLWLNTAKLWLLCIDQHHRPALVGYGNRALLGGEPSNMSAPRTDLWQIYLTRSWNRTFLAHAQIGRLFFLLLGCGLDRPLFDSRQGSRLFSSLPRPD